MSSKWIRWAAPAAIAGGLLWALFPLGIVFVSTDGKEPGTAAYLAAASLGWLMGVIPLLLMLAGLAAMHSLNRSSYGRFGTAGFYVSFGALSLMFAGNGTEVASLTFTGSESSAGHYMFLIGFLLLLIGSVSLGIALVRVRRGLASRIGGLLLVGLLPLGIVLAVVLGTAAPETDLGFWAAITMPYGIAWVLLGNVLGTRRTVTAGNAVRVA